MDKKNAAITESALNQNTVKVYTDCSKLDGRVGAGFYQKTQTTPQSKQFFHLGIHGTVFQAEVFAISKGAKNLLLEKMHSQSIVVLLDSQAAIKSLIKCTVTSIAVLNCIRNLSQLGKQKHRQHCLDSGPPIEGGGGTMIPGPMDFRGPMGFRKAIGFSGPSRGPLSSRGAHRHDTEKSVSEA